VLAIQCKILSLKELIFLASCIPSVVEILAMDWNQYQNQQQRKHHPEELFHSLDFQWHHHQLYT
jgi:hypothetical protein